MKMTKIEALTALKAIVAALPATEENLFLNSWIEGQMEVVAGALAKDKAKRDEKKAAEGPDELEAVVYSLLTYEGQSIPKILSQIQGDGISAPLITTRLTSLVKAGKAVKEQIKVAKTDEAPAHSYMTYKRA